MKQVSCRAADCTNAPDWKIVYGNESILGCESHAVGLAKEFYERPNRKENPKFERFGVRPARKISEKIPIVSEKVGRQMTVVNQANLGTGKADAINVARAMADEKKLDDAGFPKVETYFAVGTPLAKSGVENFHRERQDFQKLEPVHSGMKKLAQQVKSENRQDLILKVRELKATLDNKISIPGHGDILLSSRNTLSSLMDFTPLGMNVSRYFAKCPADLRADNLNFWLRSTAEDVTARLRVRDGSAGEEIFAVVTESYTSLDVDQIAEIIAEESPKDARVEVVYDGFSARIYVLFHTDVDPKHGVVGEIFKAGSMLKTDDVGGSSISGRAVAWRALCLNFTNMMTSKEIGRRKHMGSEKLLRAAVRLYLTEALDRVAPFTSAWSVAHKDNVVENAVSIDAGEKINVSNVYESMMGLFAGSLERELVPVRGRRHEQVQLLMQAWEKEPGPMRTHYVNAITRHAHESEQRSPWDEDEFQDAASDLLFSKKPLPYVNPVRSLMG